MNVNLNMNELRQILTKYIGVDRTDFTPQKAENPRNEDAKQLNLFK